jgi:hypothetical protein
MRKRPPSRSSMAVSTHYLNDLKTPKTTTESDRTPDANFPMIPRSSHQPLRDFPPRATSGHFAHRMLWNICNFLITQQPTPFYALHTVELM